MGACLPKEMGDCVVMNGRTEELYPSKSSVAAGRNPEPPVYILNMKTSMK